MKKLLCTLLLAGAVIVANAQSDFTFKRFKFDISAGYAQYTGNDGGNGGFLLSFEPKYALSDQLSVGVRIETALAIHENEDDANIKASGSYLVTGDYYLGDNTIRPFVGAGIGVYTHASANSSTSDGIKGSTRFGGMPRIGVEIAHFRAAVEYNLAGKVGDISKNYIGFKLGVLIGGGRIN